MDGGGTTAYAPTQAAIAKTKDNNPRQTQAMGRNLRALAGAFFLAAGFFLLLVVFRAMGSGCMHRADAQAYSAAARLEMTSAFSASIRREITRSRFLANFFFIRASRAF